MNYFHIDPNSGDPRLCRKPDNCDWADANEHYPSPELARAAYEVMMNDFTHVRFHKRNAKGKHVKELLAPR